MLILQIAIVIILVIIAFMLNDRELMAPPVLACCAYFVSLIIATMNVDLWQLDLAPITVIVISTSLIAYVLSGFVSRRIVMKGMGEKRREYALHTLVPNTKITIAVCLFGLLVCVAYYLEVARIVGSDYAGNFNDVLHEFRKITSFKTGAGQVSPIVQIGRHIVMASSFLYLFVFINEAIIGGKVELKSLHLLIPVALTGVIAYLNATRTAMVYLVFAAVFDYIFLWHRREGGEAKLGLKFYFKFLLIMIVSLLIFMGLGYFVGRTMTLGIPRLISIYLAAPVANLNNFLIQGEAANVYWGQETFSGIINFVGERLNWPGVPYSVQIEFGSANGQSLGNLYSALRYYYNDFGIIGPVVMCAIQSFLLTGLYYVCSLSEDTYPILVLLTSYVTIAAPYLPLADVFFHDILSTYSGFLALLLIAIGVTVFKADKKSQKRKCRKEE